MFYTYAHKWKSFSRFWLFATPWSVDCQALISMKFSRPEYWSGWPFPSPGDLPNQGVEPRSLALWESSLLTEASGKPKNTGVGSLSLLQGIFLTQESNRGLLADEENCRRILYQLSYQGSATYAHMCWWFISKGKISRNEIAGWRAYVFLMEFVRL